MECSSIQKKPFRVIENWQIKEKSGLALLSLSSYQHSVSKEFLASIYNVKYCETQFSSDPGLRCPPIVLFHPVLFHHGTQGGNFGGGVSFT